MRAFVISALVALAFAGIAHAADATFSRGAAVKALGYDPEAVADLCPTNAHRAANVAPAGARESAIAAYLKTSGELGAEAIACPKKAPEHLQAFVKPGENLPAAVCLAAATAAGDDITEHVSEMMSTEHPDIVAGYAEGVASALEPIRDACAGDQLVWAKVATQALLFANRATTLREGRVCALWRIALDKELKAATAAGQAKGKAVGVARFQTQVKAALDGAHHFCGDDFASGLIDANVDLTKMLLDSMPDK